MTSQLKFKDRDKRQRGLVPPEHLQECSASIIGCGAIGRQVALQLAAVGMPKIHLVDPDHVEEVNLATQGFDEKSLGVTKVLAVAGACNRINSEIGLQIYESRFSSKLPLGNILFCCVDSMAARKSIWKYTHKRIKLFIDARMSAEVVRVITCPDPVEDEYYPSTLFSDEEAYQDSCTAKSTIFCANIAAGLMVEQFSKYLRGMPIDPDFTFNLLSNEISLARELITTPQ